MKTTCDRCRKPIEDAYFIAGFRRGHRNTLYHEACIDEHTRGLLADGGEGDDE